MVAVTDEQAAVNVLQEPPTTSLTDQALLCYEQAKSTITRWDPFNGVTVAFLEEEQHG